MAMATTDHYTIISADTHAGANHETYREYLDPQYVADFDAWREKYKNPWKDLRDTDLRVRNWDDERRDADQHADGVVGEVIFPNTVPPFFPSFVLFAGAAEARGLRAPPGRHPGPQPVDGRLLRALPGAARRHRADLPQRHRRRHRGRDVDQGARPARRRAPAHVAPDVKWVKPLYDPDYDPLWAVLQDLDIPVNAARRHRLTRLRHATRRCR